MKKILLILVGITLLGMVGANAITKTQIQKSAVIPSVQSHDSFSYKGETGKNALTLLEEKTKISLDKSGLVTAIKNRKADTSKKEFWSFSVNGNVANVGPADYQTNDTDTIEWKIEKY